ncbi:MAG: hypothetical protein ORN54_05205 [Cyclobacteriaceae bacterium]|nr:hypothetical protein [Cyclobacteriaceae bacterium]
MSLLKSVERLQRLDYFIRKEATGSSKEFAEKLGICRSMLMENLNEMKELGAQLNYCPRRRSYVYLNEFTLIIGRDIKNKARGGLGRAIINFYKNIFCPVQWHWTPAR